MANPIGGHKVGGLLARELGFDANDILINRIEVLADPRDILTLRLTVFPKFADGAEGLEQVILDCLRENTESKIEVIIAVPEKGDEVSPNAKAHAYAWGYERKPGRKA